MGKKDITGELVNSTGVPPDQKVNKAEELTNISLNIGLNYMFNRF